MQTSHFLNQFFTRFLHITQKKCSLSLAEAFVTPKHLAVFKSWQILHFWCIWYKQMINHQLLVFQISYTIFHLSVPSFPIMIRTFLLWYSGYLIPRWLHLATHFPVTHFWYQDPLIDLESIPTIPQPLSLCIHCKWWKERWWQSLPEHPYSLQQPILCSPS